MNMKTSFSCRFALMSVSVGLILWLTACTPTGKRLDDVQGAARIPAQVPPELGFPSEDFPADALRESENALASPSAAYPHFTPMALEHLEIIQRAGFPLRVNVLLSGHLQSDCRVLENMTEYREEDKFRLELQFSAQDRPHCTLQQPQAFDIFVPLKVDGLSSGIYRVEVLGQSAEFEILMDNKDSQGFIPTGAN